jgi:hypothetical protein
LNTDDNSVISDVNIKKQHFNWKYKILLVFLILISGVLLIALNAFFVYNQRIKKINACIRNVETIESALDAFWENNSGHYPGKLEDLVPEYISEIPTCPEAGRDTYSESYKLVFDCVAYEFCCKGKNHVGYNKGLKLFGVSLYKDVNPGEDTPSCNSYCGLVKE